MVDSIVLFSSTETDFTTNGLGTLSEAASCEVVEERNGEFELTMTYPTSGKRYGDIALRSIILAKPNPYDRAQPFRIYSISLPLNGVVTINAEHISYDLSGIPVSPFSATDVASALSSIKSGSAITNPFNFATDKATNATCTFTTPKSARALLGGEDGSILDTYKGEYKFDRYDVILYNNRGSDNNVYIRYGKNLTDFTQEQNCQSVYTGIYPYWYSDDDGIVEVDGKIVKGSGTYDYSRVIPVDFSSSFEEKPSKSELLSAANTYISNNDIGVPSVSITVSFINLSQTGEYNTIEALEKIQLCDTVHVEFPKYNVSAKAKCIKTTYDCISGKYKSIELGEATSNLADTISSNNSAIANSITSAEVDKDINNAKAELTKEFEYATSLVTGGLGGYVVIRSSSNSKYPDEILIMDTNSISTAKNVWRWNKNGLAHSSNGYNGTYSDAAITMDGHITAKYITGLTITAAMLKGINLTLGGSGNGNGSISIYNSSNTRVGTINNNGININDKFTVDTNGKMTCTSGSVGGFDISRTSIESTASTIVANKLTASSGSYSSASLSSSSYTTSISNNYADLRWLYGYNPDQDGYRVQLRASRACDIGGGISNTEWWDIYCGGQIRTQIGIFTNNIEVWCNNGCKEKGFDSAEAIKAAVIQTEDYGNRVIRCYETACPMTGDAGTAVMDETGTCYVYLDDAFLQCINTEAEYLIFLQPYDSGECYVSEIEITYFVVKGAPSMKFAWEIKCNQAGNNCNSLPIRENLVQEPEEVYVGALDDLTYENDKNTDDEEIEILSYEAELLNYNNSLNEYLLNEDDIINQLLQEVE